MSVDPTKIRKQFPYFEHPKTKDTLYFDHAATSPKPRAVIEAMTEAQVGYNANVHRGIYELSSRASEKYESVREQVAAFVGADPSQYVVVFTKGTTEAMNLIASSLPLTKGKKVVVSRLEHHSNFVPWQSFAKQKGATFGIIEVKKTEKKPGDFRISLDEVSVAQSLASEVSVLAITGTSNVTGTQPDVKMLSQKAKQLGATVVVDAAQWAPHRTLKVTDYPDVDFFCFSAHKMYGPSGLGFCVGKRSAFETLAPYQFGGDMIQSVGDQETTYAELPSRFEAGTPPFHAVIAFEASLKFLTELNLKDIYAYESKLISSLRTQLLESCPGIQLFGAEGEQGSLLTFSHPQIHPHDLATFADTHRVAIRAGHHCAQPLHRALSLGASARVSVGVTNTESEISQFVQMMVKAMEFFTRKKERRA